ncbi:MAG: ABC transporter substrate-binding protein [Desulfarculaceae bacterium]|jgi:branched-chain amino acid transport system substrate-binding protein
MKKVYVIAVVLLFGLMSVTSAGAAEPIKIGSPVLLSGHGAFVGGAEKDTLEMMAETFNKQGGVNGRPLKFIFYDEEGKPDVAVRVVKRLIQRDKVDAILGVSTSWTAMPIIPIVEKAKIPAVMLASANAIVNPVRPWVFKTPVDDKIVADKLLSYMKAKGVTKLAIVSTQDGFGDGGHNQLVAHAKQYGVKIVFDEKYTMEDTDITPTLNKIKKTSAQAVVNWSSRRAPVVMTMNYRQMGLKLPLYHSHAALSKGFIKATKKNAEGVLIAAFKFYGAESLPDSDPQKKVILGYQAAYKAKYGKQANQFGACAFDGFNILTAALKKAGPDKAGLRKAIEQTKDYVGMNGIFTYSPADHGGLSKESMVVYQCQGGEWKLAN